MNVYKKIRQESGLSREEVCAMTDDNGVRKIDASRLERIENDKLRIYPNEVVIYLKFMINLCCVINIAQRNVK